MVMRVWQSILPLVLIAGMSGCGPFGGSSPSGDVSDTGAPLPTGVDYAASIQPVFDAHCTHCHNDVNKAAGLFAGLSLSSYEQAISGGFTGTLVLPGDPDGSLLVAMISGVVQQRSRMPFDDPTYFDTPNGQEELVLIRQWIAEGAAPPSVANADVDGVEPAGDSGRSAGAISVRPFAFDPATGTGSARLSWAPATDETGERVDAVYEIFQSTESPVTVFTNPTYTVADGATELEVEGLLPDQTYYFVVRTGGDSEPADRNTNEVSVRLGVYYRTQVSEPTLTSVCTLCHGGDTPQNNVSFETYQGTIGSEGLQGGGEVTPFDGEDSLIYQKTGSAPPFGSRMPLTEPTYFDTNSDARERIRRWIDQGALELPDVTPPSFSGATEATASAATAILVEWVAAEDNASQSDYPAPIRYNIYAAKESGGQDYRAATVVAADGATEITLTGLTPDTDYFIVVRALDPSGNEDENTTEVVAHTKAVPMESEPPTFAGAESATANDSGSITLAWTEATDNATPSSLIVYDVYRALASGEQDFANEPAYTTPAGAATFDDTTVETATTYYYVVRARDETGNRDDNTVEVSAAIAEADDVSPEFTGLTSATASGDSSITLGWTAAVDLISDSSAVIYNIYRSTTSGGQDFTSPSDTTAPGVTSFEVAGLSADTTYYFVVRAVDEAGNEDDNTVERSATTEGIPPGTGVDFTNQIAPIFGNCTACHGGSTPTMEFSFESYLTIESTAIGQTASSGVTELSRFDSEGSYLIWKIEGRPESGNQMPLGGTPLTAGQVQLMADWINQGILEVPDTTAPDFAGATGATPDGIGRIRIDWVAASDVAGTTKTGSGITTPAAKIIYNVYQSEGSPVSDFTSPTFQVTGATSHTATNLSASTTYHYVVRAVDVTGNMDGNAVQVSATTESTSNTTPPSFAGATGADYVAGVGIRVSWDAATDDQSLQADIVYDLYRAAVSGGQDLSAAPSFTSAPGATFFDDTAVVDDTTYYYVVRARDESGNRDGNTVEVWASTPVPDVTDPTFGGIESAVASGSSSISLGWTAAVDDVSDPSAMTYNIYRSTTSGGQDFASPSDTTAPGATSFEATGLSSDTTYYFVVRARDVSSNEDNNTAERSATTDALPAGSFVRDPTMERVCSQCHGVRMVLDDGSMGEVTPPGQGLAFFPPGFFMDCSIRSGQAWQDTVSRMRNQNGCPMTDAEEGLIVTFLSENYTGGDPRAETFTRVCSTCHTPSVTSWVPRSAEDWQRTVDRMIDRYDAPAGVEERAEIISYLGEVAVGEPPEELAEPEARIYMNLVCSTCHSPKRVLDKDTGLPDSDYRNFEDALKLTQKMTKKGCGLQGTTDVIIARWLSSVQSPTPDLVNIDRYKYNLADGDLEVRAWSSTGGPGALTLQGDGGLQVVMPYEGDGEYRLRLKGVDIFPGRITITSTDGGSLRWHRRLNDVID